jgi:cytochrome c-type biogenesis protein
MTDYAFGGLAFSAGLITFLNPCGIAMLPAYISYYIEKKEDAKERAKKSGTGKKENGKEKNGKNEGQKASMAGRIVRGLVLGVIVSLGFLAVFGLAGIVVSYFGSGIMAVAPWLTVLIGLILIVLGAMWLFNRDVNILVGLGAAGGRLQSVKYRGGYMGEYISYFLYGIGYAIASLSCTLPVFLFIVTGALSVQGFWQGIGIFLVYGAGMSLFMIVVSVLTAVSKELIMKYISKSLPYVKRAGAVVIIAAGGYIVYYQLFVAQILKFYFGI